jgi:hypothetical protein
LSGIIPELGQQRTTTFFPWQCLEAVTPFLLSQGRVPINGSGKSRSVVPGTLDGFLKSHVNRLTAGWVAAVLEKAGVIEIERTRPAYVKLARILGSSA